MITAVDVIKVKENKRQRGFILRLLETNYPHPIMDTVLVSCLIEDGAIINPDVSKSLAYLEDGEYITCNAVDLNSIRKKAVLVRLTAKGIDLLEGTIDDPGVDV